MCKNDHGDMTGFALVDWIWTCPDCVPGCVWSRKTTLARISYLMEPKF